MSSWRNQKRAEKREREALEAEEREQEQARLEARPFWQKIDEAEDIHDLKPLLHAIAEKVGLE